MLFFSKKNGFGWKAESYAEREITAPNPGRGWYHIHTYKIGEGGAVCAEPEQFPGESLALVLINIGAFRQGGLDADALSHVASIMESFARRGTDLIVRICYDTEGRGMEREPALFSLVLEHMEALAPVLVRYADHILLHQGLFVGNWGEMHGSKFLSTKCLLELTRCFFRGTQEKIPLALRRPVQYRQIFRQGEKRDLIGFYNDALLASETCLGTFAGMLTEKGAWEEAWNLYEEAQFMEEYAGKVPYGGEALTGNEDLSPEEVLERLRLLRVSYLNAAYDDKLLESWKKIPVNGGTLYDRVGQYMGYRLIIAGTKAEPGDGAVLRAEIKNIGFGAFLRSAEAVLYGKSGEEMRELSRAREDLYGLEPGQSAQLHFEIPKDFPREESGRTEIFMALFEKRGGREIYLAGEYRDGRIFLGTLSGKR